MSIDPAIFRALVAQGATPEMLLAVVEADAAVQEAKRAGKRANNAERQARFRGKNKSGSNDSNALQRVTERDELCPPNEYISNPPEPSEANASPSPFFEKVVSEWNAGPAANGARKASKLDASRKALLKARVRDHGEPELFAAMANLSASKFHCGENDRGWRANLGWFLEAKNFLKALEMESAMPANAPHAKPMTDADRTAYLAKLNSSPMFATTRNAPAPPPRTGNTGPPRSIGELIPHAGAH